MPIFTQFCIILIFVFFSNSSIYCVDVYLNYLATGSREGTVSIWNLDEFKLEQSHFGHTAHGHTGSVRCLKFITSRLLVSGSSDNTIKIWNLVDHTLTRTLYSHEGN